MLPCLARARLRLQAGALLVLCALGWFGCATVSSRPGSDLGSVLDAFHHDLRWQYFRKAAARVAPRHAAAFLQQLEDGEKDLHITEWEVREVDLEPDGQRARVRVRLKYYRMPSTVLRDETVQQVWRRTEGGWKLEQQQSGPFRFPPPEETVEKAPAGDPEAAPSP